MKSEYIFIISIVFVLFFSCKKSGKKIINNDNISVIEEKGFFKQQKRDTFYMDEKQIVFYKPNEVEYQKLKEKYGQVVIEADSDFSFTANDLLKHVERYTDISIKIVDKNATIYSIDGKIIHLPTEDINSYGALISNKKGDSVKIVKGIYPKEFYLEEIDKLKN